jgi:hypothetical protein
MFLRSYHRKAAKDAEMSLFYLAVRGRQVKDPADRTGLSGVVLIKSLRSGDVG